MAGARPGRTIMIQVHPDDVKEYTKQHLKNGEQDLGNKLARFLLASSPPPTIQAVVIDLGGKYYLRLVSPPKITEFLTLLPVERALTDRSKVVSILPVKPVLPGRSKVARC